MAKKSSKIGVGSVIENFTLISHDEDTGNMLILNPTFQEIDGGEKIFKP